MQRRWLCKGLINGIALLCLVNTAFGLDPSRKISQYVHDKWGEDKGFIGGRIYAIRQSADGYLWIGTERGLVRFDGSNFILIQRPLPDSPPISPCAPVADASGNPGFVSRPCMPYRGSSRVHAGLTSVHHPLQRPFRRRGSRHSGPGTDIPIPRIRLRHRQRRAKCIIPSCDARPEYLAGTR